MKQPSFRKAEVIGSRVATLAAAALKQAAPGRIDRLEFRDKRLFLPMTNAGFRAAAAAGVFKGRKQPQADGTGETVVGFLRLSRGEQAVLEAAIIPGEMYPELSKGGIERYEGADYPDAPLEKPVKQMMKAPYRMLFGIANDEIGYIIPKAEWDERAPWLKGAGKRWYGEVNSMGADIAPAIAAAIEELAK